jgi:hypothetical protein
MLSELFDDSNVADSIVGDSNVADSIVGGSNVEGNFAFLTGNAYKNNPHTLEGQTPHFTPINTCKIIFLYRCAVRTGTAQLV